MITFFYGCEDELSVLRSLDVDKDWAFFGSRVRDWIGNTYLRLKEAGCPVRISARLPDEGILVYHPSDNDLVMRQIQDLKPKHLVVIGVRGDKKPQPHLDFELVQNGFFHDGSRTFFIPFWPQPGLIPRHPSRGTTIERLAFKGFAGNLHPDFRSRQWLDFITENDLKWEADAPTWQGPEAEYSTCWNDYSAVDLIIGVRPRLDDPYVRKPASKLINAWLAHVPAILGPEFAYKELRRSDLDFMETTSMEQTIQQILYLRSNPSVYQAMVENGRRRSEEFTVQKITERWIEFLYETVPSHLTTFSRRAVSYIPTHLRLRLRGRLGAQLS